MTMVVQEQRLVTVVDAESPSLGRRRCLTVSEQSLSAVDLIARRGHLPSDPATSGDVSLPKIISDFFGIAFLLIALISAHFKVYSQ